MEQNFNVFDFELTDKEMLEIETLDQAKGFFFSHLDPSTVEFFITLA